MLCVTKTEDCTGKVEADAVKEAINNWGLSEGIIACCFDITSSNTGINSGSCVLLQQLLNRQLLWSSCRHHIPELILKAAFQSLFGKTTSPVETLFSTSNLPGSPLTYPTYPDLQLLLATALLWIPSLNSLMTDFFLTTYNISPEETTRSCWSWQKYALVVL